MGLAQAGLHAQVANQRIHGTTHKHLLSAWQQEKPYLLPLAGRAAFPYAAEETRKVSRDAYVSFRGNRYSVPWRVAGQEVLLREADSQLLIHRGGERLAVHLLCSPGTHQTLTVAAHHEGIPLDVSQRGGGKAKILICAREAHLPVVEVRSLLAYELAACESSTESSGSSGSSGSGSEVLHGC